MDTVQERRREDDEFESATAALVDRIATLDGEDRIAAACRGSANPVALGWIADTLGLHAGQRIADVGAGLGGPAAWARDRIGCRVVASDPSAAATSAAHRLFGIPVVRSTAGQSPFPSGGFDAALLLGVLSVVDDRAAAVAEAHRIADAVGVIDYCPVAGPAVSVGGSEFIPAHVVGAELSARWRHVRVVRIDTPAPPSWVLAAARAEDGVPRPASELEVVAAIEAGKLALHAFVGR